MAKFIATNAYVSIGGTDLSARVKSVTLEYSSEVVDASTMGVGATRERVGGFLDWTLSVEFAQDYAAANVDATLFPLVGTSVACIVKPVNTTTSATNPQFSGNAILATYRPLGAEVGNVVMAPVTFQANGVLSRATS